MQTHDYIVIWDVGGVILHPYREVLSKHPLYQQYLEHIRHSENWPKFDRGDISYEQLIAMYAKKLDVLAADVDSLLQTAFHTLRPHQTMVTLVKHLRNLDVRQFCLTNGSKEYFKHVTTSEKFKSDYGMCLLDLFPRKDIVLSADVNMKKPDQEIYDFTLSQFGIQDKTKIIFIDDSRANIEGALNAGWGHAIEFKDPISLITQLEHLLSINLTAVIEESQPKSNSISK